MSRDLHVMYVGTDVGRRERFDAVIGGLDGVAGLHSIPGPQEAAGAPAPGLVLLDAVDQHPDAVVGAVAHLTLAWPDCPIVAVTDDTEAVTVRTVLDAGATSILRPATCDADVRATVQAALEGRGLVDVDVVRPVMDVYAQMHLETRRRNRAVIESLAAAVEAKDSVTSRHLRAVSSLAMQLARQIEPELCGDDDFLFGCLLHDVGKIGVPERILSKPGALTDDEWEVMRRHPETGATVVAPLGLSETVTDVVLYHHERWDGAGYPRGLTGRAIPLAARIFSVCDALEAMTATRPYRSPIAPRVAFERVCIESGQQFDPEVITGLRRGIEDRSITLHEPELEEEVRRGRRFTPAV